MPNGFFKKSLQKRSEAEKVNITTKFKQIILKFWTKLTEKGYFQSKKEKNEKHHRFLHIRINLQLSTKYVGLTLVFV